MTRQSNFKPRHQVQANRANRSGLYHGRSLRVEKLEDRRMLAIDFFINSFADAVDLNPGDGTVDTGTPGEVTLRAAIMEANALVGDDTIMLDAGNYSLTIAGTNEDGAATGDLDITDNLTLIGTGASVIQVDGIGIDRALSRSSRCLTRHRRRLVTR